MTARTFLLPALSLWLCLGFLAAQERPEPVAAAPETQPAAPAALYPSWSRLTPAKIQAGLQEAAQRRMEMQKAICAIPPGQETFENVFEAYDRSWWEERRWTNYSVFLSYVIDTEENRQALDSLAAGDVDIDDPELEDGEEDDEDGVEDEGDEPEQVEEEDAVEEDAVEEDAVEEGSDDVLDDVPDEPEAVAFDDTITADPAEIVADCSEGGTPTLLRVVERAAAQPWVNGLSPAKRRYVQQVLTELRGRYPALSDEKTERINAINSELNRLISAYRDNVVGSTAACTFVVTDASRLAGMSEAWMQSAQAAARAQGACTPEAPGWLITESSMLEVIATCTVEETRKLCWEKHSRIGYGGEYDNEAVVVRILELRRELARLLGYKSYAEAVCQDRMLDNADAVAAFLDDFSRKIRPAFEQESRELLEYISARTGRKTEAINPWDYSFYMREYLKERDGFDAESLRPYLRSDNVLKGALYTFSKLYDVTFTELPAVCLQPGGTLPDGAVEVWHPDVKVFQVTDNKTGAHIGSVYLDLYPRPTKRSGGYTMPISTGDPFGPRIAAVICNLTPPNDKGYALFSTLDLYTFFHEFGHVLDYLFCKPEVGAHLDYTAGQDFVELASQIHENWVWEPEFLVTCAFHHETGEPAPAELLQQFAAHRYSWPAISQAGYLGWFQLDFRMHMDSSGLLDGKGLDAASGELTRPYELPQTCYAPSALRHMTHCIYEGYDAGLYCYLWSQILAADAFTRFRKEGIMNPETGAAFRECILSPGGGCSASEMYRNFMGRDPDPDSLLREKGILPAGEAGPAPAAQTDPVRIPRFDGAEDMYAYAEKLAEGDGCEPDLFEAVVWYRKAAEQGHAMAQYRLGVCYAQADGIPQDWGKAVEWYTLAAEQGCADAMCALGHCFVNARGTAQDDIKAVQLFMTAANKGCAEAQYTLGLCYELGFHVPQNTQNALKWYHKAAVNGHAAAMFSFARCHAESTGGEGEPDEDQDGTGDDEEPAAPDEPQLQEAA